MSMAQACPSLICRTFHVPKRGCTRGEYEDAFAADPGAGRFAIADGASESSFAGSWARIVVRAAVTKQGPWSAWLPAARKCWRTALEKADLPWYTQTKIEEGAFAALLGVHFEDSAWHAEAVGDSCLFLVRAGRLHRTFPLRHSEDFNNQPNLLGSRPQRSSGIRTKRLRTKAEWLPDDVLFLMTDALAQWFLEAAEKGDKPWQELLAIESRKDFGNHVESLRAAGLRNDDVTVAAIRGGSEDQE